jgi:hypothetical protein
MGRSNPSKYVPNPAKHTVNWAGADGCFSIYDKEKKERVLLDLPFGFVWVESFAAITGYNEPNEFFIQSNEVRSIKDTPFAVVHYEADGEDKDGKMRFKKVVDHEGMYNDIKDAVKSKSYGGRYTTVLYGIADRDMGPISEGDLIRIEVAGAALNAWIDKGFNHYDGGIVVEEAVEKKKGRVTYFQPIFKMEQASDDHCTLAVKADAAVNAWMDQKPTDEESPEDVNEMADDSGIDDEIPF